MGRLFFFGSSSTWGAWDATGGGWVDRLKRRIFIEVEKSNFQKDSFYCTPYNLGVSGDNVEKLLKRLDHDVLSRNPSGKSNQFVFAIGSNDSACLENGFCFTEEQFEENIRKLVKQAQKFSNNISFIGMTPVNEALTCPILWSPDKYFRNERLKNFSDIISGVCKEQNLRFLPLFNEWGSSKNYKSLLKDGLHPNAHGHERLAKLIGEFLLTEEFYDFHSQ